MDHSPILMSCCPPPIPSELLPPPPLRTFPHFLSSSVPFWSDYFILRIFYLYLPDFPYTFHPSHNPFSPYPQVWNMKCPRLVDARCINLILFLYPNLFHFFHISCLGVDSYPALFPLQGPSYHPPIVGKAQGSFNSPLEPKPHSPLFVFSVELSLNASFDAHPPSLSPLFMGPLTKLFCARSCEEFYGVSFFARSHSPSSSS